MPNKYIKMLNIFSHWKISIKILWNFISPQSDWHYKKYWWACGEKGTLIHCWLECKLVKPLWKTVWRFLKNLKIEAGVVAHACNPIYLGGRD
jgi:hypothetical protein